MQADGDQTEIGAGRRWNALPVMLGALAGIAVCALALWAHALASPTPPNPAPTAHAICADLTAQRYDHLYTLLSPELQRQGTQQQFVASQRELDNLTGVVHACSVGATTVNGDAASVSLAVTRGQAASVGAQVALTLDQQRWSIASYDQNL